MKIRIALWVLLVVFTAFLLSAVETLWLQRRLADKTLRLHVVANSDSAEDQAQKLRVRDAVLAEIQALTRDCTSRKEAEALLAGRLSRLAAAAQTETEGAVRVSLGAGPFPTRKYDSFTLPAGDYPAVRVELGAAGGRNWWCVVFPSLCTAATSDALEHTAQVGGFDEEETDLIVGGEEKYELRFQTFEWLQALLDWLT